MSKIIALTQGKETIVDDDKFIEFSKYRWRNDRGYAVRHSSAPPPEKIYMHREVMQTPTGIMTDHINGNTLDNRRENLRVCTKSQNAQNARKHKNNFSGYKGVYWDNKNKNWQARIKFENKFMYLGRFYDAVEAAHAYDRAAHEFSGEFARPNFLEQETS